MRVVVVSAWEPWRTADGAAFVLDHHLARLAPRHDITLLAAGAPAAEAPLPPEAVGRWPVTEARWFGTSAGPAVDHLRRRLAAVNEREPAHVRFVERPGLLAALDQLLADGVDVVHLHGWGTAKLVQRLGTTPAVHMAIDPWTVNVDNRRRQPIRRLLDRSERRWIARHEATHYPRLSSVAVVTDRDAELIREIAPEATVAVVPNGVELGSSPAPIARAASVLGFHGVFDSQANVDAARNLVTEIWPLVRMQVPDARVHLVGRRPPAVVRELETDGVELRADVADLRSELEQMTVHVDWMTSGAGIKNKVLEAMAAARPVVASALGAEGIGAGPGLTVAADVDAAARAISAWLLDAAAARTAGAAGRARVAADFSWDRSAGRVDALWQQAAGSDRSR
jgi:glycosyltransferase involved in cell wall biosynthesis